MHIPSQTQTEPPSENLIWCAAYGGCVLLIPDALCQELLQIRKALAQSQNWQAFLDALPESEKDRMGKFFAEDERFTGKHPAEVPFDQGQIGWLSCGDWPAWPEQEMLDWVPEAIQYQFGEEVVSILNGNFLRIPEDRLYDVIQALEAYGFHCRVDDTTVLTARGML